MCAAGMMVLCNDELSLCADSSEISDCQLTIDPEVPRGDYWACVQCKNRNNNPLFRYCEKCYKVKFLLIIVVCKLGSTEVKEL